MTSGTNACSRSKLTNITTIQKENNCPHFENHKNERAFSEAMNAFLVEHKQGGGKGRETVMTKQPPPLYSLLPDSIFISTISTAARVLVSGASSVEPSHKWTIFLHLRFLLMLLTWISLWFLRLLMDLLPSPLPHLLPSSSPQTSLIPSSSHSPLHPPPSFSSIARALSHVLAIVNEIPASSNKYQFVVGMAERIVEENARVGEEELLQINHTALSSAFTRTSTLLYHSLLQREKTGRNEGGGWLWRWPSRMVKALPLGSYLSYYFSNIESYCLDGGGLSWGGGGGEEVEAEKYAEELLWITGKLQRSGDIGEAVVQWSMAAGLAEMAVRAEARVQGVMLRITAELVREMRKRGGKKEVPEEVKVRMMVMWMPLLCHGCNGVGCPVLNGYERGEMERVMEEVIGGMDHSDQEMVLRSWIQDFAVSASDWPNLQLSYDQWCRFSRSLPLPSS